MLELSLKRETMRARIAALLRRAIITGEFPPEAPMVETGLALRPGAQAFLARLNNSNSKQEHSR